MPIASRARSAGAGAPLPETRTMHTAITAAIEDAPMPEVCTALDRALATGFRAFAQASDNELRALACVLRSGAFGVPDLLGFLLEHGLRG
jgi:hypothetical protein